MVISNNTFTVYIGKRGMNWVGQNTKCTAALLFVLETNMQRNILHTKLQRNILLMVTSKCAEG